MTDYLQRFIITTMKPSETKLKKIKDLKEKARFLYKQLGTYRQVGEVIKKSHTWVMNAVREGVDK